MLIELILFLILGIAAGTLTGLIPGIHINLIGAFLISISATLLFGFDPIYITTFIVAMAITHTFLDFIPSIFLGCPDTDTELSVLPGHDLLKKGSAYEAIILTAYGSLAAILILLVLIIPAFFVIENFYDLIKNLLPYILIAVSILLVAIEKKKVKAALVFLLTGILGLITLNIEINQSLLPLLTGLFGASSMILSIKHKTKIPKQKITKPKIKFLRPLVSAGIASPICSFLPGLGSGQAAIIGNLIAKTNKKGFLFLLGATNTIVMGFSFLSLYLIGKTRTGAAVALKEIVGQINFQTLVVVFAIIIVSGFLAFQLTKFLAKTLSNRLHKANYKIITLVTLSILLIITILVSGLLGVVILITSTLTGIYCINLGVRRTNMMGALLLPTIFLYLL